MIPGLRAAGRPAAALSACVVLACATPLFANDERTLVVQASAYNSLPGQTQDDPNVGAWGDSLQPGMKAIAVSRDLIDEGLTRGVRVRIEGLAGEYEVRDKMAQRWRRKIDIYMGEDVQAALDWGLREVRIHWSPR